MFFNTIKMEVFMHIFSFFTTVPLGEGFGFNGNILETNIINLTVVIGIVVSFGGDALRSLLENRKQIILNNLQQADQRAKEAQEKLQQAKTQLELAKNKASEIRQQGNITAEQEKKQCIRQTQDDIMRLEEFKQNTLRLQQQKAINQVSQQVVSLALTQVKEKLNNRLDSAFHASVNNFNIVLFTNYKSK
uniref:ATP synthase subunit b, chloroplastic n=1 Tax=Lobosphaera incisa TaxID=312850 RepID=A0A097KLZ7_9CHLO|nr:CF0 subunit I of ATP synthase [Lobosphaera incisa]AIT94209.1 CF0 subunit I of ATP synthase [Lobosphaera incisa]